LEGLALCREKRPAVVLVDLGLPDGDGFQLAAQLKALVPAPRILLLSSRADDVTLFRAWSGPVEGLIWKSNRSIEHLQAALGALAAGRRFFPADVLAAVNRFRSSPNAFFKILSPREQSLIQSLVRGDSDENIAEANGISRHTVHSHRKSVMAKLGLHSLRDLIHWGAERGFGGRLGALASANYVNYKFSPL
jgi:DNA-binding NarL/FixJ family response regulator